MILLVFHNPGIHCAAFVSKLEPSGLCVNA